MYLFGLISGSILLALIFHDAFEVMLLPRRVRRKLRFITLLFRYTWNLWSWLAERMALGIRRDTFLSLYGPLSLVMLIGSWVIGLMVGFALIQCSLSFSAEPVSFGANFLFSGDTFFTLGTASLTSMSKLRQSVAVLEAGTGLAFLAIVIGYLPVLYQLFSRRETHIIMLDARAGSPPNATTLLSRHGHRDSMHALDELLHEWEQWSAEVVESHLSYPMLSYYRSQHDNQSWLAALTVIMDSCALVMVGIKTLPTFQARMTFSSARLAVVELGRVLGVKPQVLAETRLASSDYAQMRAELKDSGMLIVEDEGAEERLIEFRSTYEPFLTGLAEYLLLTLPGWLPSPLVLDNWQNRSAWPVCETSGRCSSVQTGLTRNRDAFSRRVPSNQSTFQAARDFLDSSTE